METQKKFFKNKKGITKKINELEKWNQMITKGLKDEYFIVRRWKAAMSLLK